jgi:hypothetical protein
MPQTTISNLFVPPVWLETIEETSATIPSLASSGLVVSAPQLDVAASGPGTQVVVPTFKDISDQDEANQVESTGPAIDNITTGQMIAPTMNRVKAWGSSSFASQLSGADPVGQITRQIALNRLKRQQKVILALLRGAFNGLGVSGAAAALSAVRMDRFLETGNSATATELISTSSFIRAVSLMGELRDGLMNGAVYCHPAIRAALEIIDAASFKSGVESDLPFKVETYRGIPIYTSNALSRAGTTNGTVYETYILANGIIGRGSKAQSQTVGDMASFLLKEDEHTNDITLYDRTRSIMHLNGMRWTGTPANVNQGPTNAELGVSTNWALAFDSAQSVGAVLLRTNG